MYHIQVSENQKTLNIYINKSTCGDVHTSDEKYPLNDTTLKFANEVVKTFIGNNIVSSGIIPPEINPLKFGKIYNYDVIGGGITYIILPHIKVFSFDDFVSEIPEGVICVRAEYKNLKDWSGISKLPKTVVKLCVRGNNFKSLEGELSETNVEDLDVKSCNLESLEGIHKTKIMRCNCGNNPCKNYIPDVCIGGDSMSYLKNSFTEKSQNIQA